MDNETLIPVNEIVIPARSRWRIESNTLPELSSYTIKVQHDYYTKSISIVALDAIVKGKPVVHEWIIKILHQPREEMLTLSHYSSNGNIIYKKILKEVKLIGHKCNHNYESEGNDLQDHELLFMYEELQTIDNIN